MSSFPWSLEVSWNEGFSSVNNTSNKAVYIWICTLPWTQLNTPPCYCGSLPNLSLQVMAQSHARLATTLLTFSFQPLLYAKKSQGINIYITQKVTVSLAFLYNYPNYTLISWYMGTSAPKLFVTLHHRKWQFTTFSSHVKIMKNNNNTIYRRNSTFIDHKYITRRSNRKSNKV